MNAHIYVGGKDYGTKSDWFLFCGWTESKINTQYQGFYKQVQCASSTFGNVFRNGVKANGKRVGNTETVDGQTVTYENAATLSLYNYTPHIQTSFFSIWTSYLNNSNFAAKQGVQPCSTPSGQFCGEYYNNRTLSNNPTFIQNTSNVNFDWGNNGPGNGLGTDNFSVRWQGNFSFENATYIFTIIGDDGIRLFVDGTQQIDGWRDQGATTYTKDLALSSGNHTIKVEYYENGGGATAKAYWQKKPSATYGSAWVSQSSYPTVTQGGYADLSVTFRNTGNTTWYNTYSPNRTHLATLNPNNGAVDYPSPFVCTPGWIGNNRPTALSNSSVAPGANGTFNFRICVPAGMAPGTYRIAVAPLIESVSWMLPPSFVYWDVTVKSASTGNTNLARGKSVWATSNQSSAYTPTLAVDGNNSTRWSSAQSSSLGPQWLIVDLGNSQNINQIIVNWEWAFARDYFVGYSNGSNCNSTTYSGWNYYPLWAETKTVNFPTVAARCVAVYMRSRAPGMSNYSIWELQVFNK
jgi:hypothetical protein